MGRRGGSMAKVDISQSCPIQHALRREARLPQVRTLSFAARLSDVRPVALARESFAVSGPLALLRGASYRLLVHQPAASFRASSPRFVASAQLHFPSFVLAYLREDLHLQDSAHAGRTASDARSLASEGARSARPRSACAAVGRTARWTERHHARCSEQRCPSDRAAT